MHKLPVDISRFWARSEREITNHCFYLRYRDLSEAAQEELILTIKRYSRSNPIKRLEHEQCHQVLDYLNVIILQPGWINKPVSCAQGFNCWAVERLARAIRTFTAKKKPNFEQVKRVLHESVVCTHKGGYYAGDDRNPAWNALDASMAQIITNQNGVTVSLEAVEQRYQF